MELSKNGTLLFYFGIFFLISFLAFITERAYKKSGSFKTFTYNKGTLKVNPSILIREILLIALPVILLTFRYGIGTDYFSYRAIYHNNINTSFFTFSLNDEFSIEFGNNLLVRISNFLFHDYHGYIFLTALIICGLFFYFLKEYTELCRFSLMVFICLVIFVGPSMNIIRQVMAVAIVIQGFKYIFSRKFLPYLIFILVAAVFHSTALIMIPVYFLYSKKEKQNAVRLIVVICICLFLPVIMDLVFRLLPYIPFLARYASKYTFSFQASFKIIYIVLKIPIILYVFLFYKKLISKDSRNEFYIYLFLIELAASFLGSFSQWSFRIMYYGMISEIILVPQLLSMVNGKNKRICYFLILGYYIFCFWFLHYVRGNDGIFPYTFSLLG